MANLFNPKIDQKYLRNRTPMNRQPRGESDDFNAMCGHTLAILRVYAHCLVMEVVTGEHLQRGHQFIMHRARLTDEFFSLA